MPYEQIEVGRDGAVQRIAQNRPDKLNALTGTMSDELVDALTTIDEDVRAVLLTGNGRGFCAGQDLTEFEEAYREGSRPDIREHLRRTYHRLIPVLADCRVPTVAAVGGVAAGAGLSLALACDVRLASDQSRFTLAFAKIGLVPDSGGTYFLPRVVGYARALDLAMTNEMIDAPSALEMGLVTRVIAGDTFAEESLAFARRLASLPTRALVASRDLMRGALTSTLEDALDAEGELQARMAETQDHLVGVMAFAEKREATFHGR